ncbi:MAG TPA: M20/M25/M40 family metallo-hydrolase [Vicinamibacterales bacterium]|jgi:acetylornithine deacetylase/succinyl-diaminopimelate desuccinylase-like protein
MRRLIVILMSVTAIAVSAQGPREPDWATLEEETLRHFQTLVRMDTTDPPGGERPAAEYLKQVLDREGIPSQMFALEAHRPNLVARLKGNGKKRPLLIMGHTDTVNVDPAKWKFPPFSATRSDGHIYGRGTVDDKDNVVAALMSMLTLKRLNVPLDRDVIFLAESGEEGSTRVGIQFMVNQHFAEIDAEFCFAEGGGMVREGGQVKYATVQTLEKIPRAIELTARGPAGHGSIPLRTNAVAHLAAAVAKVAAWEPPISLNETTAGYFKRLATISTPQAAERYLNVLDPDPKVSGPVAEYLMEREPRLAALLRHSVSPNIIQAGYRVNVIPSEAKATLDVRLLPHESDPTKFLEAIRKVVNDPAVDVSWAPRDVRPGNPAGRLDNDAYAVVEAAITKHYQAINIPTMSTGATDMAYLRAQGMQCYGVGPATDVEDGPLGFGSHSDQERIREEELQRFVRFHYDLVAGVARAR